MPNNGDVLTWNTGNAGTPADPNAEWAAPAGGGPTPGDTVTTETAYGQASGAGASADYSRKDHTHGTPAHDNHTLLSNIGTNSHPTIDAHLANYADPHFPWGMSPSDRHYVYSDPCHTLDTIHWDNGGGTSPTATGSTRARGIAFDASDLYQWTGSYVFARGMAPTFQFYATLDVLPGELGANARWPFFDIIDIWSNEQYGLAWGTDAAMSLKLYHFYLVGGAGPTYTEIGSVVLGTRYQLYAAVSGATWLAAIIGGGGQNLGAVTDTDYMPRFYASGAGEEWTLQYLHFRVNEGDVL